MKRPLALITLMITLLLAGGQSLAGVTDPPAAKQVIRWRAGAPIQIAVSTSLTKPNPNITPGSDVAGAIRRSFATWQRYVDIELVQTSTDKQNISPAGPRGDGISIITIAPTAENALIFADNLSDSAAATRVFYGKRGSITEADIALNQYKSFSTDGSPGTFDLESTITHEIGHLLGLEHSPVLGATMHEKYGENGAYRMVNYSARTLSQDDLSALRRIYGPGDSANCCQRVEGTLRSADGKARRWDVWAEDTQTGQVKAMGSSDDAGNFAIGGMSRGSVSLYARDKSGDVVTTGELGTVTSNSELTHVTKTVAVSKSDVKLEYLGFNEQLSDIAVPLNAGKIYELYLGGQNLDPAKIKIGFTSPYLSVVPQSIESRDFGNDVSVVLLRIQVDPNTPPGDYTVYVAGPGGVKRYIVGGITIEKFQNPHSKFSLTDD
jgi:hypothetical protein